MRVWRLAFICALSVSANAAVTHSTAITIFGKPKFAKGFDHLGYADPKAPKGGTIVLGSSGGFDSLNAYALKGNPAPGLNYLSETLTTTNLEDARGHYCLICDWMEYPTDRSYIVFHINPLAKFSDGTSMTAEDVVFSFTALTKTLPQYKNYFADVLPPIVVDPLTVRFNFKKANNELPAIVGELPVLSKKYWGDKDLAKTTLQPPIGSGPYKIKSFETGRSITYEVNPDYWAKDLPLRRGVYNFAIMRIDIYNDEDVALEAFKGGAFDFRVEAISKNWQQGYESEGLRKKQLIKELIPDDSPQGAQGFTMNMRRAIFKDVRVREALGLLFDFEWMNKNLFYGAYRRSQSFFENSTMAASGAPKADELKILNPLKAKLSPDVFKTLAKIPVNETDEQRKDNLRRALALFEQAGWTIKDGKLKNAAGEQMSFEFLLTGGAFERVINAYKGTLAKAGIDLRLRRVDPAQSINRLRDFDFDMIVDRQGETDTPGNEQRELWGSAAAKEKGSHNYAGIESPAVDAIIEGIVGSTTIEALTSHVHALDRVLRWMYPQIPNWNAPFVRVAYWNKFGRPKKNPPRGASFETWWVDPIKDAQLKKDRG